MLTAPMVCSMSDDDQAKAVENAPSHVAQLEALWPLAKKKLLSLKGIPTWMRLKRRYDLRFLQIGELRVEVPAGLMPDCEGCTELCCTGPNAEVTLRMRDICALLDSGLQDAISVGERNVIDKKEKYSTRWRMRQTFFGNVFPVLKRDSTLTCVLLDEKRQCNAWPQWPLSCARYPYSVDATHKVLFLAGGCRSHRTMGAGDVPDAVRKLVRAAVDGYNERIKDLILLHLVLEEVHAIGVTPFLDLPHGLKEQLSSSKRAVVDLS
ncbi:MAG: hypothetical protein GY822_25180 [Deltaproteobacteria bacterium]|nr:hypothetical protein [Deltaproteobacteria bacterium]